MDNTDPARAIKKLAIGVFRDPRIARCTISGKAEYFFGDIIFYLLTPSISMIDALILSKKSRYNLLKRSTLKTLAAAFWCPGQRRDGSESQTESVGDDC